MVQIFWAAMVMGKFDSLSDEFISERISRVKLSELEPS